MKVADPEADFIAIFLDGIREYVQAIEAQQLPGGRRLVFLCAAGCRSPDGTTPMQIICNAGDAGIADIIRQLQTARKTPFRGRGA